MFDPAELDPIVSPPKNYNKFQISKMFGDGYQVVIRTDTYSELVEAMTDIQPMLESLGNVKPTQKQAVQTETSNLNAMCKTHGVSMQAAISKKTGKEYWFHKSPEGAMCFGKGYQEKGY